MRRTPGPSEMTLRWVFESPGKESRALGTSVCLPDAAPLSSLLSVTHQEALGCSVTKSGVPRGHSCTLLCGMVGKDVILPLDLGFIAVCGIFSPWTSELETLGSAP